MVANGVTLIIIAGAVVSGRRDDHLLGMAPSALMPQSGRFKQSRQSSSVQVPENTAAFQIC